MLPKSCVQFSNRIIRLLATVKFVRTLPDSRVEDTKSHLNNIQYLLRVGGLEHEVGNFAKHVLTPLGEVENTIFPAQGIVHLLKQLMGPSVFLGCTKGRGPDVNDLDPKCIGNISILIDVWDFSSFPFPPL